MIRKWVYWFLCIFVGLGLGYCILFFLASFAPLFDEPLFGASVGIPAVVITVVFIWLWKKFIDSLFVMRLGYGIICVFFVVSWFLIPYLG